MHARSAVRGTRGVTLFELLVVLAVLGIVLGVTGLAIASLHVPRESAEIIELKRARTEAIHSGAPRTVQGVRFLPDGRAIGPNGDPLTGSPDAK